LITNDQAKLYKPHKQFFACLISLREILVWIFRNCLEIKYLEEVPLGRSINFQTIIDSFGQRVKKDLRVEANDLRILIYDFGAEKR
jgi:hypothetical protein